MMLSHLDGEGRARMVDVSGKDATERTARAVGRIRLSAEAYAAVEGNSGPKGDVMSTAELAGVLGAKRTAELIPLCHPIGLDHVQVQARLDDDLPGIRVEARATAVGRTGVEMEALTAVAVSLLTVYDMVKALGYGLEIESIRLEEKAGGRSGHWKRTDKDSE